MFRCFLVMLCLLIPPSGVILAQAPPESPTPVEREARDTEQWWLSDARDHALQVFAWSRAEEGSLTQLGSRWLNEGASYMEAYLPHLWAHPIPASTDSRRLAGTILSLPSPEWLCGEEECVPIWCQRCPAIIAYVPPTEPDHDQSPGVPQPLAFLGTHERGPRVFEGPLLVAIEDLTGDGAPEVIIEEEDRAATGRNRIWSVFRQDGSTLTWVSSLSSFYSEDSDRAPALAVLNPGGPDARIKIPIDFIASAGAGLQRGGHRTFRMLDQALILDDVIPYRDSHPYYLAVDGRRALVRGDMEQVQALVAEALASLPESHPFLDDDARHQLTSYLHLLDMMAHIGAGDVVEVESVRSLLGEIQPNPMLDLTFGFLRDLSRSDHPGEACRRLDAASTRRDSELRFLTFLGYATERLEVRCPETTRFTTP